MCGRCFCTLEPPTLSKACSYKKSSGKSHQVPWFCPDKNNDYKPSPNIGPRDYLPVIAPGKHFASEENRILVPMLWGMVPQNWTDDPKRHNYKTHNARIETIRETLFKEPLTQGCRCVVIVEGYYEWQTAENSKTKQPYFLYALQKEGVKIENKLSWKDDWSEDKGWEGLVPLKMAGLFKKSKNTNNGEITYSCTIITTETNSILSWLHHRSPIFLNNTEDEEAWLNYSEVSKDTALDRIINLSLISDTLNWHPVSTSVNNVRYKNRDCIMPVKSKEKENQKAKQLMSSWLKGSSAKSGTKRESDDANHNESNATKKLKMLI